MLGNINIEYLSVIEHESRNFIWNNKIFITFATLIYEN